MAKFKLNKTSKRQPARLRYKVEKKIRQHNKKSRREAKKNPKKNKQGSIQIPNICPFKEDILKEIETVKKLKIEEIQKKREEILKEKQKRKEDEKKSENDAGLDGLVAKALVKGSLYDHLTPSIENSKTVNDKHEQSLKQYYKEFKKVIDAADVVLEILDARDPLGTRCKQVEEAVQNMPGNKRLVLVLNKADLVPRDVLDKWLKFLRKSTPAVAFKASTQNQNKKLSQRKISKSDKGMQGSASVGAELIMSLLANYCRNKGIKTSIRVGIVGLPNVGKSSVINSLKRSRACSVGSVPGVTRSMQEVQLDSKIMLLDSPGIVFASGSDSISSLRNAVRISSLSDPFTPANAILQRVTKQQMMEMYDVPEYNTPEEFFHLKASRNGRYKRGGIPDTSSAAKGLLEDWNSGKIKYYTIPPEETHVTHISSSIVSEIGKEFNLDEFETMETEVLNKIEKENVSPKTSFLIDSLGPVDSVEEMDEDDDDSKLLSNKVNVSVPKKNEAKAKGEARVKKGEARVKKVDPESQLEGNQKLNKIKKLQFKKEKKQMNRRDKVAQQLSTGLEKFTLSNNAEDYNFDEDFIKT